MTADDPLELPVYPQREPDFTPAELKKRLRPSLRTRAVDAVVGSVLLAMAVALVSAIGDWGALPILGVVAALFTGSGGLLFLRRAFGGRPAIEWDEEALYDRTSFLGGELRMPWIDIRDIHASRVTSVVRVELEDDAGFLRELSVMQRIRFLLLKLRGVQGVEINPSFLRVDWRDLGGALEEVLLDAELTSEARRIPSDESEGGGPRRIDAGDAGV